LNLPALARRFTPADAATLCAEAHAELKKTMHSRFHGVSLRSKVWSACIVHRYTVHRLGTFGSEEEAAVAYDKAAIRLHGSKAKLNFHPETGEVLCGQRIRTAAARVAARLRRQHGASPKLQAMVSRRNGST